MRPNEDAVAIMAGAIYTLAVADALKTHHPTPVKLKQLSDQACAAARAFLPALEQFEAEAEAAYQKRAAQPNQPRPVGHGG